jgi:hypothetical protein
LLGAKALAAPRLNKTVKRVLRGAIFTKYKSEYVRDDERGDDPDEDQLLEPMCLLGALQKDDSLDFANAHRMHAHLRHFRTNLQSTLTLTIKLPDKPIDRQFGTHTVCLFSAGKD